MNFDSDENSSNDFTDSFIITANDTQTTNTTKDDTEQSKRNALARKRIDELMEKKRLKDFCLKEAKVYYHFLLLKFGH